MSDWETVLEGSISSLWSYSAITGFNVFRFTCTNPINLASIAIAQAEVGATTQLFDLQRLGIRSESEICVIEKPPFFSDRRIAIRGIPYASNKPVSGLIKIEGMSMAISQIGTGFSAGWTRDGNKLISPTYELFLSCDGSKSTEKVFLLAANEYSVQVESLSYGLRAVGNSANSTVPATKRITYYPSPEQGTLLPVYLSDIEWLSATNGYGPVEKDMAVGGSGQGDGPPLTLNGTVYPKGLGCHANSEVIYELDGLFESFSAIVGVDDNVRPNGSVIFQVEVDGQLRFDSGLMTGLGTPQSVDVSVIGAQQIKLIVADGGDGISYDHGDWADAKLIHPPDQPVILVGTVNIPIQPAGSNSFSARYGIGKITPPSPFAGQPKLSLLCLEWSTGNSAYYLEGCSTLKYRFIWS